MSNTNEKTLKKILETEKEVNGELIYLGPFVQGYFKNEKGTFTAFDNSDGHCWVEDFETEDEALSYSDSD